MEFKVARLDRVATIISILTTGFLIGLSISFIMKMPYGWIFAILMMSIVVITYLLSPKRYYFEGSKFIIEKVNGKKIIIPLNEIEAYVVIPDFCKLKASRAFGDGGLFGYYGIFSTAEYGNINCQLTSMKNIIIIKAKKGLFGVSPLEVNRFEEYLKGMVVGVVGKFETIKPIEPTQIKYANPLILIIPDTILTLTVVMAILLYRHLPERVATHFDFQGNPNAWSSKISFISSYIVMSFIIFAANIITFFIIRKRTTDPRVANFVVILISLIQLLIAYVSFDIYWFNVYHAHFVTIHYGLIIFFVVFVTLLLIYYNKIMKDYR